MSNALACAGPYEVEQSTIAAHALLALADGLALRATSTAGWWTTRDMHGALELVLDTLT